MLARLKFEIPELVEMIMTELADPQGYYLDVAMGGGQFVAKAETMADPSRVIGWESNKLRVQYACNSKSLKGDYSVRDPRKEFSLNVTDLNVIGNWPFTSGTGRAPVAVGIMDNLLRNGVPKSLGVILHSGFLHTADGGLAKLRNNLFDAGLYKIVFNPVDAFRSGGAKVRTVTVLCKRGYTGPITVVNQQGSYDYDFRSVGYIVDGGSRELTDWLCSLRRREPVIGYQPKNDKTTILNAASEQAQPGYLPFLRKMSVKGDEIAHAPASCFADTRGFDRWRLVVGYRPSGLEMGDPRLGLTTIVRPGVHVLNSPYVCINADDQQHAINLDRYLHSQLVEDFLLPRTRTSPTLDCKKRDGQTKFVPMLPAGITINNEDDVAGFLQLPADVRTQISFDTVEILSDES